MLKKHRQEVKERRGVAAKEVACGGGRTWKLSYTLEQNRSENLLLYHIEIVSVVSLVDDVLLRFDQYLKHGVQNLRELLLKKAISGLMRQPLCH